MSEKPDSDEVKNAWQMHFRISRLFKPLAGLNCQTAGSVAVVRDQIDGDEAEGRLSDLLAAEQLAGDAKSALTEMCDCFGVNTEGEDTGSNLRKSDFGRVDDLISKMGESIETLSDDYKQKLSPFCIDHLEECHEELERLIDKWARVKWSNDMGPEPDRYAKND